MGHTQRHDVLSVVVKAGDRSGVQECISSIDLCCGTGREAYT